MDPVLEEVQVGTVPVVEVQAGTVQVVEVQAATVQVLEVQAATLQVVEDLVGTVLGVEAKAGMDPVLTGMEVVQAMDLQVLSAEVFHTQAWAPVKASKECDREIMDRGVLRLATCRAWAVSAVRKIRMQCSPLPVSMQAEEEVPMGNRCIRKVVRLNQTPLVAEAGVRVAAGAEVVRATTKRGSDEKKKKNQS